MDQNPLVIDEIEAGKELINRLNDSFPVIAACWLRKDESSSRDLYVALDELTAPRRDLAYREVVRIADEVRDQYINPSWVNLIEPTDPIAKAILEVYARFPGRKPPTRTGDYKFGGVEVGELYIYPPLPKKPLATTQDG
jgi:hypothetical protein